MADILVVNGEILWDDDDLAFVNGDEDIKQQAYLRSTADEGESVFYPSFGSKIFMYLGKSESPSVKSYIESAAREALLRVTGISEVIYLEFKSFTNAESVTKNYIFAKYKTENGQIISGEYIFNV